MERLNEAIDWLDHQPHAEAYTAAKELRAYADLLANGGEPNYEAAYELNVQTNGGRHPTIRDRVDAAIGDRLLINPLTEEDQSWRRYQGHVSPMPPSTAEDK